MNHILKCCSGVCPRVGSLECRSENFENAWQCRRFDRSGRSGFFVCVREIDPRRSAGGTVQRPSNRRQFDEKESGTFDRSGDGIDRQSCIRAREPTPADRGGRWGYDRSHSGRAAALRSRGSGQWAGRRRGAYRPLARRGGDQGGDRVTDRRSRRHARAGRRLQRHLAIQRHRAVSGGCGPREFRAQSASAFGNGRGQRRDDWTPAHHTR